MIYANIVTFGLLGFIFSIFGDNATVRFIGIALLMLCAGNVASLF